MTNFDRCNIFLLSNMFILNTSFKQLSRNIYQYVRHYKIAPKPILLQLVIQTQRNNFFQTSSEKFDEKTVNVPPLAESVTEGDIRIQKKLGEHVAVDEVIMEIETDKTSVIVPAPGHGIIKEFLVKDGDTVKIGQALFKMDITGKPPEGKQTKLKKEAATPAVLPKPPILSELPKVSVEPDVAVGHRHEQRVKMNRMRLKITERLKEAEMTSVMLTTFNEIDMLEITKFRKETQESFQKKFKIKFGFMSMFLKASAYALLDIPVVNAVIDKKDIIYRDYVDISVAVATPKGLVVPVIKNVENMTFGDIELSLAKLGQMARNNTLAVEDMTGGTFTVSNGGVFGSLMSTPIINPPQSAILGMHGIFDRPVAIKGKVEIRPMMYVALTYDHRLVDGREAVMFLRKIKACVEDPRVILTGL